MWLLMNVWTWAFGLVATTFFGSMAILTSWTPPRGRVYNFWARAWSHALLFAAGVPVRVEVSSAAAATPQAIFMPNHTSAADIVTLFVALDRDVRFVAKKEVFMVPFLGWSMWLAGFIPVDRQNKAEAREVFDNLGRQIQKGVSILVFPEGTRSRSGRLLEFKKSGFLLALKTGIPIVPVGISGAREVLGADGIWVARKTITVRVGDPIPTAGLGLDHRGELVERVRAEILRLSHSA